MIQVKQMPKLRTANHHPVVLVTHLHQARQTVVLIAVPTVKQVRRQNITKVILKTKRKIVKVSEIIFGPYFLLFRAPLIRK